MSHTSVSVKMTSVCSAPVVQRVPDIEVGVAKLNREKVAHIRSAMTDCFMMETRTSLSSCLLKLPTSPSWPIDPHSLVSVQGAIARNLANV